MLSRANTYEDSDGEELGSRFCRGMGQFVSESRAAMVALWYPMIIVTIAVLVHGGSGYEWMWFMVD
jgi:hypothetical protein